MIFTSLLISALALAQPVYETVVESERAKKEDTIFIEPKTSPRNLSEVINSEPGVQIQSQGSNQFQSFLYHGSSSEDLLVVVNGVVMNDPTSPSAGFDFSLLDPSLIHSVRLWPHSRAVRWGRGAVSGVLEIQLKKKVQAQAGVRVGSLESGSARIQSEQLALSARGSQAPSASYSPNAKLEDDASSAVSGVMQGSAFDGRADWMLWGVGSRREYDRLSEAVGDDENARAENQNFALQLSSGPTRISFFDVWRKDHNDADSASPYFLRGLSKAQRAQIIFEKLEDKGYWWQSQFSSEWSKVISEDSFAASSYRGTQNEGSLAVQKETGFLRPGLRVTCLSRCEWLPELSLQVDSELELEFRAAQGLKSPSLFQKFSPYGNRSIQAERRNSYSARIAQPRIESGWKVEAYWNTAEDLIDFDVAQNKYFNRKKANLRGASIHLWQQNEINRLQTSYEFLEASDGETGAWLVRRARHNVGASYTRRITQVWSADIAGKFLSERPDVDSAGGAVTQSSQVLWDVHAKWQRNAGNVFTFSIINLTDDRRSFIYGYGSGGRQLEIAWDRSF